MSVAFFFYISLFSECFSNVQFMRGRLVVIVSGGDGDMCAYSFSVRRTLQTPCEYVHYGWIFCH